MTKTNLSGYRSVALTMAVLAIGILIMLPFFAFSSDKEKVFVDDSTSGKQTGSSTHPFKTIDQAIDSLDDGEKAEIFVSAGTYKENIELPKRVKLIGTDKDKVIIEADDDGRAVVKMNHKSELQKVTVRKGKYGVKVDDGDEVSIWKCIIKDNDENGVKIEAAPREDKYQAFIGESEIKDNGRSGIYSQKRRLVLMNNLILNNEGDGITLESGVSAYIHDNRIKDNDKSGLAIKFDGSLIWAKNNTYYDNGREGVEIKFFGGSGNVNIYKSKFYKNDRWGLARTLVGGASENTLGGLKLWDNIFSENVSGEISQPIFVN